MRSSLSLLKGTKQSIACVGSNKTIEDYKKDLITDDHKLSLEEIAIKYNTDLHRGLTELAASGLLAEYGPNCLLPPEPKSRWVILGSYLFTGFSLLLWIGAVLVLLSFTVTYIRTDEMKKDELYLGGLLVGVNLVTGLFGFYQETVNSSVMEGFKKMMPKLSYVIRDGVYYEIASEELVIGDLIELRSGECVSADVRIIVSSGLKVDNSSITGESDPQTRSPEYTDQNPLETANLAFYGTSVVEGSGYGIVVATGVNTLMGSIAGLTSRLEADDTNIKREIKYFVKLVTYMAVTVGVLCFVCALSMGYDIFAAFIFCIAMMVANVPEGLLVTMTACLTLTAKRMARKNCLVKNLQCIETLGSTNVICSDKTGTLTQNIMKVSHMYYDQHIVDVLSVEYKPVPTTAFKMLCRVAVLCSKTEYDPNDMDLPPEERKILGDASERAVFICMENIVGNVVTRRNMNPKISEIPFNSTNKYQVSIHRRSNGQYLLVMKGAPERIVERCSTIAIKERNFSIENHKKYILKAVLDMGYMGERVLGFADYDLPTDKYTPNYKFDPNRVNFPLDGLRFVGLMSLIDPPKDGVLEAVQKCQTAGIKVIMLTGDHPITAMSIAKKVGIISPGHDTVYDIAMHRNVSTSSISEVEAALCSASVVTGGDLRNMTKAEIDTILDKYEQIVFARTSPQQKLLIVEAFQRRGDTVAVTGDGVNDSPALKKADIGISMGISGSDVSKEAADMILLDDNFASIVTGIEQGRLIFDNLKKSIAYLLTSNLPEIMPFLAFVFVGIPNPLSIMAIIIIDVGTDLWPAISLAYEKAEADIMKRNPRNPYKDTLVNYKLIMFTYIQIGVVQTIAGFTAYFVTMAFHGFHAERVFGLRKEWDDEHVNDLKDSYGQEWSYYERKILEKKCYSAFFMAIALTQVADVIVCKTRRLSIVHQGMNNWVLNFGCVFELCLASLVIYCPYVNNALQFEPVEVICFLPALPYAIVIIVYDEIRRYCLRKYPGGWVERETYF